MTEAELHGWLCWGLIGLAAVTFVVLLVIDAPYGRHDRKGWGPTMPTRWMWVLMEAPASLGFLLVYVLGQHRLELVPLLLLLLWQLHYFDRAFLYPFRIRATGKRTPILVATLGMLFQSWNGYINARSLSELTDYASSWLYDPRFLIGLTMFFAGRHMNRASDATLIALRKSSDDYHIPEGGMFRLVSCPNYLGEIIEWIGWAVMTWSLAGVAFALYTAGNLVPRALAHHRWYREKFSAYPTGRRAIIPFLL